MKLCLWVWVWPATFCRPQELALVNDQPFVYVNEELLMILLYKEMAGAAGSYALSLSLTIPSGAAGKKGITRPKEREREARSRKEQTSSYPPSDGRCRTDRDRPFHCVSKPILG